MHLIEEMQRRSQDSEMGRHVDIFTCPAGESLLVVSIYFQ